MAKIHSSTLPNGLPLYRVDLPGTRAVTVLVAFEAGARTEREDENGMAHFLEHLVFKGGQKYDDYRKVNETAERMGAMLNAYTSHDLVAFHITCRAESVGEAIDLLTDFVGRPKIDQEELDRERGVVIQEIARANDQPSVLAEHLIDRAAFGDHPLGRPVLGPEEHLRTFSRDAILAFRRRQWAGARGGAFLVGNLSDVPENQELVETFGRFPSIQANGAYEPAPAFTPQTLVEERDSNQSHLRISYRPAIEARDQKARAALAVYGTLLGGSMGSRLFDEIREQRGLAYSVYSVDHAFADVPILQLSAGLESGKCGEAYARMREIVNELRSDGPREDEVERARAYAAGRRVLAFENTNAVARHAATQTVVHGEEVDPDRAIALLDEVTFDEVAEVARGISEDGLGGLRRPARGRRVRVGWCEAALRRGGSGAIIARVSDPGLNRRELDRYVQRVTDRWPAQRVLLGGARVADLNGAPPQRERGPEFVVVFVSEHFDGVPWLERVYQTGSLWDAYEMGASADVHCYTPGRVRAQAREPAHRARGGRARARAVADLRVAGTVHPRA